MSATLAIRHHVRDYAAWRKVYDELVARDSMARSLVASDLVGDTGIEPVTSSV
jgi:hypothetical protein